MRRFDLFGFAACIIVAFVFCGLGTSKAMAQENREYVPFVEEGKIWYCGYDHDIEDHFPCTAEDPSALGIDCIFTMCGDSLMNGKKYKKVYCQFEEYYGDKERHYYCAVREEAYQVFIMEEEAAEEKLLYDFSRLGETITLNYDGFKFARRAGWHRSEFLPGQLVYTVCKFTEDGDVDIIHERTKWVDGVGAPFNNPFAFELRFLPFDEPKFGKEIIVRTCMKEGKHIFMDEWMAEPTGSITDDPIWGDLNNDGEVGISDVMDLIEYILSGSR